MQDIQCIYMKSTFTDNPHTFRRLWSLLRSSSTATRSSHAVCVASRISGASDGHQGIDERLLGFSEGRSAGVGGSEQEVLQG